MSAASALLVVVAGGIGVLLGLTGNYGLAVLVFVAAAAVGLVQMFVLKRGDR